jgi:hypothetical protein
MSITLPAVEALLRDFLSPSDATRRGAEAALLALRAQHPLASLLLGVARASGDVDLRQLSCVLLRRVLTRADPPLWKTLDAAARAALCAELLAALPAEPERKVRLALCDVIANVAAELLDDADGAEGGGAGAGGAPPPGAGWPALWPFMRDCVMAPAPALREAALTIFERLGAVIASTQVASFGSFREVFLLRLRDAGSALDVRVAAARAAASLITSIDVPSQREPFAAVLPDMLALLVAVTAPGARDADGAEAAGRVLAGVLSEVAGSAASLFRSCLHEAVRVLAALGRDAGVDGETRRSALETLVTIAEGAGPLVRKTAAFLPALVPALVGMLAEWGDSLDAGWEAEWEAGDDEFDLHDDDAEGRHVDFGGALLGRLGGAVGAAKLLPVLQPLVAQLLARPEWVARHAALDAIIYCAEFFRDDEALLAELARTVAAAAGDAHPRVRAAALDAFGALASYQGPMFQMFGHTHAMPAIVRALGDASRRVRINAVFDVTVWVEALADEADADYIVPYVGALMAGLMANISAPDARIASKAITSVSAIGSCAAAGDALTAGGYYVTMRPGLLGLLHAADGALAASAGAAAAARASSAAAADAAARAEARRLKGKAIECLSVLGVAAGAEAFAADARALLDGILSLLGALQSERGGRADAPISAADDPVQSYCWDALGRIASFIGAEAFAPALPTLVPWLLAGADANPVVVTEAAGGAGDGGAGVGGGLLADGDEEDDDDAGDGGSGVESVTLETGTRLRVRTAELEDKTSAVAALKVLFRVLRPAERGAPHLLAGAAPAALRVLLGILTADATAPLEELRFGAASTLEDVIAASAARGARGDAGARAEHGAALAAAVRVLGDRAAEPEAGDLTLAYLECLRDVLTAGCDADSFLGAPRAPPPRRAGAAATAARDEPLLDAAALGAATRAVSAAFAAATRRRGLRAADAAVDEDGVDEEAAAAAEGAEEEDAQIHFRCVEVWGALWRTHGAAYAEAFAAGVGEELLAWSAEGRDASDVRLTLFLGCDVLECGGDAALDAARAPWAAALVPRFAASLASPRVDLRQAAAYGLGIAAEACERSFAPYAAAAADALGAALRGYAPTGTTAVDSAHDNMASALAKVAAWSLPRGAARAAALGAVLARCPLSEDFAEAAALSRLLGGLLAEGDADAFTGGAAGGALDGARVAAALRNFAVALRRSQGAAAEAVQPAVRAAIAALAAAMPAADAAAVWATLPAQDRETLAVFQAA